ncbi:ABC transporter permease [Conexibacter stalactiti]|uniref:ABC transporter permease n=1 Tax=Conexibacter stalactiti TaxID=1940611 RepID=A0ABU4HL65_9ACTN|nr:ABC transporter permease [Conexibacter stalactiti]MDW5594043.1 ABC transporter permease [Conexibacter stalactiti]MEC5034685.1 ABC transporter permease [Conexibacter stalactiti]
MTPSIEAGVAPRRRAGGRRPRLDAARILPPIVSVLAVLALFELLPRVGIVSARQLPPSSEIVDTFISQLSTEAFWRDIWSTLQGWALGLGIAIAIAVPLGLALGSTPLLHRALRFVIEFLRPIPSVALIPLVVLLYGTGLTSKVFLAAFGATWPLLIQVIYGVQDVDPVATDTGRMFGLGRFQRMRRITLPSLLPYAATGLRIAATTSLLLTVTGELVIGAPGLGHSIDLARTSAATTLMYALILATGLVGIVINSAFRRMERRTLRWHPSQREVAA